VGGLVAGMTKDKPINSATATRNSQCRQAGGGGGAPGGFPFGSPGALNDPF
jgi:hypothetical protein